MADKEKEELEDFDDIDISDPDDIDNVDLDAEDDDDDVDIEDDSEDIDDSMDEDIPENDEPSSDVDLEELVPQVSKLFMPAMAMQGVSDEQESAVQESFANAGLLLEKNLIQFDNPTKAAQLLSLCSMLIAKNKNSADYKKFVQASADRRDAKLSIQETEANDAKTLAQKFLIGASSSSENSTIRNIAKQIMNELK